MDFVDMFVTAIIAIALLPVLVDYIDASNFTGIVGTLVGLVPVLYVILLVAGFAYWLKKGKK